MKTQAVIFPEANRFEMTELHLEAPGPADIVVRTLVTAISPGTERWVLRGKHIRTRFPCVPGYHRIGIVEQCGAEAVNFQPGDVVYGSANRWSDPVISMWGAHVALSVSHWRDYHFVSAARPGRLELETAAFTMLAAVATRGIRACDVQAGQRILIVGAGFLGLCAAQLAALKGAEPVLLERDDERLALAGSLALHAARSDDPQLDEKLKAVAPAGFDTLYDTVGHAATTDRLVPHIRHAGTLLLQAQYFDKERCAIDLDQIKVRELTMKTTCGTDDNDWFETIADIRNRRLRIAPLITHRFAADEALKGYELLHNGKPFNLGIVFHWDQDAAG
ncbi:MAG: zinc-binding dehydrogenase [Kiritimatiellae bacterium]|nr:zinc-binding dehydrogenase [Kiritimatiellia bacterium]